MRAFTFVTSPVTGSLTGLPGHSLTQTPHPTQFLGETWILNFNPFDCGPPIASRTSPFAISGSPATSFSSNKNGLIVACGHTNAHWLHWIQFSFAHTGTLSAIERFSLNVISFLIEPSNNSYSKNFDVGKSYPSSEPITLTYESKYSSPVFAYTLAFGKSLHAGSTGTSTKPSAPASIASQFILTISSPFLP